MLLTLQPCLPLYHHDYTVSGCSWCYTQTHRFKTTLFSIFHVNTDSVHLNPAPLANSMGAHQIQSCRLRAREYEAPCLVFIKVNHRSRLTAGSPHPPLVPPLVLLLKRNREEVRRASAGSKIRDVLIYYLWNPAWVKAPPPAGTMSQATNLPPRL